MLDGKRPNTVIAYRNAIAKLAENFSTPPDQLTEQQVRQYLLHCRKKLALNSIRPILGAIKFFYRVTAPRQWPTLDAMRLPKSRTVPKVLSPEKCWQIIHAASALHLRAAMQVAFTCGLRSIDVRQLKPKNIHSDSRSLNITNSKGGHQRRVPIPAATIDILRQYWKEHRNPNWIFPSRAKLANIQNVDAPISPRSLQRGIEKVLQSLGWSDQGIVFHTLRHSYATAMLDEGVNLKVLSGYLGHKNLQATEVYLHLTRRGDAQARQVVQRIFDQAQPKQRGEN